MTLPLSGIKVVDFCRGMAGPLASMFLADQGAEVIKIEPPEGDHERSATLPFETDGMGIRFLTYNRNKRSVVLDVTKPKGRDLAYRLFRWADVLIINMRVITRQRRGFTYDEVAAANPRIIYSSLTGYGDEGPEADLPGIDLVIQARSGDLAGRRLPGSPPPGQSGLWHFDMSTAIVTFCGVIMGLWDRERTGKGQKVESSLLQSAMWLQALQLTRIGDIKEAVSARLNNSPAHLLCSDGRYIYVTQGGERWGAFCRSVGLEELQEDPRFDTQEKRTQNDKDLQEILSRHFATRPSYEWEARLKADSQYVSVIKEIAELYDDPQVVANGMLTHFDQPGLGKIKAVNLLFGMSNHRDEPRIRRPAPVLGEHGREVLLEIGCTSREIEALKREGVVNWPS